MRGNWRKLALVAVSAAAIVLAVVLPDALAETLRDWLGLKGDEDATMPWVRGALIAFGLGLLLWLRRADHAAWADAAPLVVFAVAVAAGLAAYLEARKAKETKAEETTPFSLAATKVVAAIQLPSASSIIVLAVEPEKANTGLVLSYASTRYEATLCHAIGRGRPSRDVAITLKRGADDANASAFAADLLAAERIHLLATAKEKEAKTEEAKDAAKPKSQTTETKATAKLAAKPQLPVGCPVAPVAPKPPKPRPFCRPRPKPTDPPEKKPMPPRQCDRRP